VNRSGINGMGEPYINVRRAVEPGECLTVSVIYSTLPSRGAVSYVASQNPG
jgi:hypothetical protein